MPASSSGRALGPSACLGAPQPSHWEGLPCPLASSPCLRGCSGDFLCWGLLCFSNRLSETGACRAVLRHEQSQISVCQWGNRVCLEHSQASLTLSLWGGSLATSNCRKSCSSASLNLGSHPCGFGPLTARQESSHSPGL